MIKKIVPINMALKNPKFVIPTLFALPILSCLLAIQNIPMVVDSDNGLMISALEQYHSKKNIPNSHIYRCLSIRFIRKCKRMDKLAYSRS